VEAGSIATNSNSKLSTGGSIPVEDKTRGSNCLKRESESSKVTSSIGMESVFRGDIHPEKLVPKVSQSF
jgi:hypothetical protein